MNNSEPASPNEEMWTAYIDGALSAEEVAAFERAHPEAVDEKKNQGRLGAALRKHAVAPELKNPGFFNESIQRELAPTPDSVQARAGRLWPLWRLAAASAFCLALLSVIYLAFVRGHERRRDSYIVQVLSVQPGDQQIYTTVIDADGVAVVWIDGLDSLPSDYALQ